MGIADFNLETKYADRILVLSKNTVLANDIGGILAKRSYRWIQAEDTASSSDLAKDELFDLIVLEVSLLELSPDKLLSRLRADPRLKTAPIIVVSEKPETIDESLLSTHGKGDIVVVAAPLEPAQFLVKVATQLRMRKLKSEKADYDAKIAAQNAKLRDLTNRFQQELLEARSIQQAILPKELPKDPRCVFASSYEPLEAVGGDLYDIFTISDGVYGILIGDVTGHGLPAAFIGAMTKMGITFADKKSPGVMLSNINEAMADLMPQGRFVTVCAAIYDAATGKLMVARGGHPEPYVWRKETGAIEMLSPKGLPLGVLKEARYQVIETVLQPGDKFMMITDGLTETADMNGQMLGTEGIGKFFAELAAQSNIQDCLDALLRKQAAFTGGRILKDDNTLVGIERLS